jgi:type IX secretion system PorP/SprF family membrane protein
MKTKITIISIFFTIFSNAQEGIAVYSDYLSDNYYLLHPSMAGASNCTKIRLTARQQWFDVDDAPQLQTLSAHGSIGEKSGAGIIAFNDRNGYHSQMGMKLSYAHHIMFSRSDLDLNMLSFGMSGALVQSRLDETTWNQVFDPMVGGIVQKDMYFNMDIGASYHFLDFYSHFTVKNALANTRRELYSEFESDNLRKYIFNTGYTFGNYDELQWEPSVMFQFTEKTQEKSFDINLKLYKPLENGKIWGGVSYRRSLDGAQFINNGFIDNQKLQYITPILGVNYKNFMVAYTYSYLTGDVRFDTAGFHQLTLGINLFCKPERWSCNCPAIN